MTDLPKDVYFELSGVASVKWDQSLSAVVTEWEGWANPDEFSGMLQAEIRALRAHRGSRQLVDCRRQKGLRQADQEKADQDWLPKAVAVGLRQLAVVRPTSGLAAMNLIERLSKVREGTVEVRYFDTVEEARAWLVG